MVAADHVGKIDGDEDDGYDAGGNGIFHGRRTSLCGQVLQPDDEADGQDAEETEIEITPVVDGSFKI